eukprot:3495516-Lingulodinium_polyedra.AAC.1
MLPRRCNSLQTCAQWQTPSLKRTWAQGQLEVGSHRVLLSTFRLAGLSCPSPPPLHLENCSHVLPL